MVTVCRMLMKDAARWTVLIIYLCCLPHIFKFETLWTPCQAANGAPVENKMNLPVPVYLRPLEQKDISMKVQGRPAATLRQAIRNRPAWNEMVFFPRLPAVVRRRRQHVWGEDRSRVGALQAGQRFPEQPGPPGLRQQGKEVEVYGGSPPFPIVGSHNTFYFNYFFCLIVFACLITFRIGLCMMCKFRLTLLSPTP